MKHFGLIHLAGLRVVKHFGNDNHLFFHLVSSLSLFIFSFICSLSLLHRMCRYGRGVVGGRCVCLYVFVCVAAR